ncbi:MAG: phosphatase PAP2 family protein, partial [Ignavibacteriaceae bacterium]|nr:phosphatase PAP2 family protein [Ignavibacteriaceae bacterium]
SRVYLGLHYPSDILGGAIIGAAIGYAFAKLQLYLEEKIPRRTSEPQNPGTSET